MIMAWKRSPHKVRSSSISEAVLVARGGNGRSAVGILHLMSKHSRKFDAHVVQLSITVMTKRGNEALQAGKMWSSRVVFFRTTSPMPPPNSSSGALRKAFCAVTKEEEGGGMRTRPLLARCSCHPSFMMQGPKFWWLWHRGQMVT